MHIYRKTILIMNIWIDIAADMLVAAKKLYEKQLNSSWHHSSILPLDAYDYVVASGIFNVKLDNCDHYWLNYIFQTLDMIDKACKKGFAFNCLTSYSDIEFMRNDLYYANPLELFDYCKKSFSRNVSLIHDYDLYEFTLLVRKDV